jgi:hypothetical protein
VITWTPDEAIEGRRVQRPFSPPAAQEHLIVPPFHDSGTARGDSLNSETGRLPRHQSAQGHTGSKPAHRDRTRRTTTRDSAVGHTSRACRNSLSNRPSSRHLDCNTSDRSLGARCRFLDTHHDARKRRLHPVCPGRSRSRRGHCRTDDWCRWHSHTLRSRSGARRPCPIGQRLRAGLPRPRRWPGVVVRLSVRSRSPSLASGRQIADRPSPDSSADWDVCSGTCRHDTRLWPCAQQGRAYDSITFGLRRMTFQESFGRRAIILPSRTAASPRACGTTSSGCLAVFVARGLACSKTRCSTTV